MRLELKINSIAPIVAGALIAGGASLVGGGVSAYEQRKANKSAGTQANRDRAFQKEFAQHGIRWKVEDAKAAGIHPLAALGAQTTSFSPVRVGSYGDSPVGRSLSQAGQNIGRAVASQKTKNELEMERLALDRARTENKIADAEYIKQMRDLYSDVNGPTMPNVNSMGVMEQDIRGSVDYVAPQKNIQSKAGYEAGYAGQNQMVLTDDGFVAPVLTQQVSESMENDIVERFRYAGRKVYRIIRANYHWRHPHSPRSRQFYQHIRNIRPPAPPGYEMRLHTNGLFKLVKKNHPRDSRFWYKAPTEYRNGRVYKTWVKN